VPNVSWMRALLLALPLLHLARAAEAATYYAAKTACSDSGSGSASQPFCTLGKGVGQLQPGDTLLIQSGAWSEQLKPPKSGTSSQRITIAAAPGAKPEIDGSSLSFEEEGLVTISSRSCITIRGLTLRRSPYYAVKVSGSSGVIIEGNLVDTSEHGGIIIDQGSTGIAVINNEVANTASCGEDCGIHEAITLSGVASFVVAGNTVRNGTKEGIDAKDGSQSGQIYRNTVADMGKVGIYLNHCKGIKVYENHVRNNGASGLQLAVGDYALAAKVTTDNEIYGNVFSGNAFCGVQFWVASPGDLGRNKIYNNVMYGNKHYGIQLTDDGSKVYETVVRNNIFVQNDLGGVAGSAKSASTISHNLFWSTGGTAGTNTVTGDPMFVAPGSDFHLRAGSPAIDRGYDMGLPKNGAPDIGAYEYGLAQPPDGGPARDGIPSMAEVGVRLPDGWQSSWEGLFIPDSGVTMVGGCGCGAIGARGLTAGIALLAAALLLAARMRRR